MANGSLANPYSRVVAVTQIADVICRVDDRVRHRRLSKFSSREIFCRSGDLVNTTDLPSLIGLSLLRFG